MRTILALASFLLLPAAASAGTTAWVSSNHIQVIDLDEGRVVARLGLQEFIHDMEFSPDGTRVYVGSSKGFRVADAEKVTFTQRISESPTLAVSVSSDGTRVMTLSLAPKESAHAARKAGLPLPPATISIFAADSMTRITSFEVDALARDAVLSPDAASVYVVEPKTGALRVFSSDGVLRETIQVVPAPVGEGHLDTMLGRIALSPDGASMAIPVTNASASSIAEIDLAGTPGKERVHLAGLGHSRRIQGLAFDDDGSGVYVTAVSSMVKFGGHGFPVAWKKYPVNFVDVAPVRGSENSVMVTPTFSKKNKSGGVALVNGSGEVVRTVELMDMSPFLVVVQPTP
jgi:DNA-binding beta-propeller fold protein YncE